MQPFVLSRPERVNVIRHTNLVEWFQTVDEHPSSQEKSCLSDEARSVVGSDNSLDCEYVPIEYFNEPPRWSLDTKQDYLYPERTSQRSLALSDDDMKSKYHSDEQFLPEVPRNILTARCKIHTQIEPSSRYPTL